MPAPDPEKDIGRVKIGTITLHYRDRDGGGKHYLQRGHAEEYHSRLYPLLAQAISPAFCVDIGANYGYTGLLMRRAFPEAHLTLVEPVPWLEAYIKYNFDRNNARLDRFEPAICSVETAGGRHGFGVRELATQDSRVFAQPGMTEIQTNVVTLDDLTANIGPGDGLYLKVDTQGWEERVFAGGENFLMRHDKWFCKTEFAPEWLESQGTNPVSLLSWLMARFSVHESPGRVQWTVQSLNDLLGTPLPSGCEAAFVTYVRNLALNDKGWVDLYLLPPPARRTYALDNSATRPV